MLTNALINTAGALSGYWDGLAANDPAAKPADHWTIFSRLEAAPKAAVLAHDLMQLLRVEDGVLKAGGAPVLTLLPPTVDSLKDQLPLLRAWFDLRQDRLPEILVQASDLLSFFGAQLYLHPDRTKQAILFLSAVQTMTAAVEQKLKFNLFSPRPIEFQPLLQPMIQTPSHSTYPSGHATEAFVIGTLVFALREGRGAADGPAAAAQALAAIEGHLFNPTTPHDQTRLLPFLLAARIAENRTVAGVHFPVDSAHGAMLGLTVARVVLTHLAGGGKIDPWKVDGNLWKRDFTFAEFRDALRSREAGIAPEKGKVKIDAPPPDSVLPLLWQQALAELA